MTWKALQQVAFKSMVEWGLKREGFYNCKQQVCVCVCYGCGGGSSSSSDVWYMPLGRRRGLNLPTVSCSHGRMYALHKISYSYCI